MTTNERVEEINRVVIKYFQSFPEATDIFAKDLMDDFIKAKIFTKNNKDGLPIRNFLRLLDSRGELHLLPLLRVDRKSKNRNWYFTLARHYSNH